MEPDKPQNKPAEKASPEAPADKKPSEAPSEKPAEKPAKKPLLKVQLAVLAAFCAGAAALYWMPRFLSSLPLGSSPWISYSYTYGLSLLVFAIAALWIFFTRKSRSPEKMKEEKTWLTAIFCGLCVLALIQGIWILSAFSF